MRRALFVFALALFAISVHALSVDSPSSVSTNTAFAVAIVFDALDSFSDAVVQLNESTIISVFTRNGKLFVDEDSIDKSVVMAYSVSGQRLFLLLAGFDEESELALKAKELGKEPVESIVSVFTPLSSSFEESYSKEFTSLKNTIMSYANDIDDLKEMVSELRDSINASSESNAELSNKVEELNSRLEGIQGELSSKASVEELNSHLLELQQGLSEQQTRLSELEQQTKEFTSAGFISFAALKNNAALSVIAGIAIVIVVIVLAVKGRLTFPKRVKQKSPESVYRPSKSEGEAAESVLNEVAEKEKHGRWAFKGGSWKPKNERHESGGRISSLGDLIKRD